TMLHRVVEGLGESGVPESLRCLLLGGAPAGEELIREAVGRGFPVAYTYGLTEASSQVATAPPGLVRAKPGTVGSPLPGVELRLSSQGEILVKGPTVAPGHGGEDGWLATGDLGREDEDGHLWISGRLSDRIISGGVNVDPAEVEALLTSHSAVRDALVLGVPDPEWGERVVAVVAVGRHQDPSEVELEEHLRRALSSPKRPRAFYFVDALPLNPNGKVDRERVRAILALRDGS
ncbi:AMP-binding protein, partial [Gemmatimonadota bacterium]